MVDAMLRSRAAEKLLMHARTLTEPRWTPLPHQVPPEPGFYGWLLMAGRGAGKTDACARYIHEHVYGPPCLPGPIPHWIGIVAPTLGDAATSCYAGPSGLRVHSPEAKMTTVQGGTVIRWPNGSEAKLFGAHSPEDVERLRSGGNRCAAEGTLVQTEHGPVPIEQVRPGDRVWTRNGLRVVLHVWDNGLREVHRYDHDAGSTWLTPDHDVWTDEGWIPVSSVKPTGTVFTWGNTENRSATTASCGTCAGTATTRTSTGGCCTGICTSGRSGRYPTACTSITRTTTSLTTAPTTSCCCGRGSTGTSITASAARTGTPKEAMRLGGTSQSGTSLASGAVSLSSPAATTTWSGTAPTPVVTMVHGHGKNGCAACAATRSSARFVPRPAPVRASALRTTSHRSSVRVYDLTVEHDHEFFADGLLVSNCLSWLEELAAWRYLDDTWDQIRFGLRSGPRPHWVASTTPKPRALIKKLNSGAVANVVVTRATTYDNPHLPEDIREALEDAYGGTQIGRQELYAEVIDQDENALWNRGMLDATRVRPGGVPHLVKKTVGVDPSGGRGEQGIVVVGKALLPREHEDVRKRVELAHGFVIADRTCHLSPDGWGRRAVQAAIDHEADDICVEVNFGGDMAIHTIRSAADAMGISIPIKMVRATRGKKVRAEPVSALTEQGRWHLAGNFTELEDQLCTWYEDLDWSPDRLDAMVWPGFHQRIVKAAMTGVTTSGGLAAATRTIG